MRGISASVPNGCTLVIPSPGALALLGFAGVGTPRRGC